MVHGAGPLTSPASKPRNKYKVTDSSHRATKPTNLWKPQKPCLALAAAPICTSFVRRHGALIGHCFRDTQGESPLKRYARPPDGCALAPWKHHGKRKTGAPTGRLCD
jgi:hypothetical protein